MRRHAQGPVDQLPAVTLEVARVPCRGNSWWGRPTRPPPTDQASCQPAFLGVMCVTTSGFTLGLGFGLVTPAGLSGAVLTSLSGDRL